MRITREFGPYNHRRYGRPWIARVVSWPTGQQPQLEWGGLLMLSEYPGAACVAEIEARPGDLIRWGQRDYRGGKTASHWGVVTADGAIDELTAVEARNAWTGRGV